MALTGTLSARTALNNVLDNVDLSTPAESISQSISKDLSSGVVYHDTATIASSGTLSLDFGDDSLSDVFGNSIAMTTITGIYIKSASTNTVDINVSTGTTSIFNDLPPLGAGEGFAYLADIDVTTNNILYIDNGAAESKVDIIVCGTEA